MSRAGFVLLLVLSMAGVSAKARADVVFPSEYEHDLFCGATLFNGVYDAKLSEGGDVNDPAFKDAMRTRAFKWVAKAVAEGAKLGKTIDQVNDDVNNRSHGIQNGLDHGTDPNWLGVIQQTMKQCDD
jgi:hypothetical protein